MSKPRPGPVGTAHAHDSATKHVSGSALYIDDLPEPPGTLHVQIGLSARAHARVTKLDLDAVRAAPGVVDVITAADIPGANDVAPTPTHDDPIFARDVVQYAGQSLFAVVATTRRQARAAARLADHDHRGGGGLGERGLQDIERRAEADRQHQTGQVDSGERGWIERSDRLPGGVDRLAAEGLEAGHEDALAIGH